MRSRCLALGILGLALVLVLVPAAARGQAGPYTVQPGDSLKSIAAAYGVTVEALIQANQMVNPDYIQVGQQLVIPGAAADQPGASAFATPTRGPAAAEIAPATAGPATNPRPEGRYVVQPGDTVQGIALRFGANAAAIVRANDLANPNLLAVGATLIIPSSEPGAPATASPTVGIDGLSPALMPTPTAGPSPTPFKPSSYNKAGGGAPTDLASTRLMVSIAKQHCWLYVDGANTGSWPCSTGRYGFVTIPGYYTIQTKLPIAYGSTWGWYMPYWLGIYQVNGLENGIHGLPYNKWGYRDWANRIGTPISFGCIVLKDAAAKQVYEAAELGMQVVIQK